jgi:protein SCO1/2
MNPLRHLVLICLLVATGIAHSTPQKLFQRVGFDQNLGARLPLDVSLRDSAGRTVALGSLFGQRPVILVLGYYDCPNLCGVVWQGLLEVVRQLKFTAGTDFDVVALSINPAETPALARAKQTAYLEQYNRPGTSGGWHFLTGDEPSIRQVADAVGFRYLYDPTIDQYAHASGLVVATSHGVISRYLYGVRYQPSDLRLALVEASGNRVGSAVDRLLLLCYHYDPETGRYGLVIMNVLRGAGALTAVVMGGILITSWRRERQQKTKKAVRDA